MAELPKERTFGMPGFFYELDLMLTAKGEMIVDATSGGVIAANRKHVRQSDSAMRKVL
jgi:hypothetical protein